MIHQRCVCVCVCADLTKQEKKRKIHSFMGLNSDTEQCKAM